MKTVKFKLDEEMGNLFRTRSVREVLKDWHHMSPLKLSEAKEVILRGTWPPIGTLDNSLLQLEECVILSLSKNKIEKISHLTGLRSLKVLSLAQNNIKSLNGLEAVGSTLEVLIIARNFIKETKGTEYLFKLKELDISYNCINQISELERIDSCKDLRSLAFKGNPLEGKYPYKIWREEVLNWLPKLETLDYIAVEDHERGLIFSFSEIYTLKGDPIINDPDYMIYNEIFREAKEKALLPKQSETEDDDDVYSTDKFIKMMDILKNNLKQKQKSHLNKT